jgi:hypothetical protein
MSESNSKKCEICGRKISDGFFCSQDCADANFQKAKDKLRESFQSTATLANGCGLIMGIVVFGFVLLIIIAFLPKGCVP